MQYLEQDILVRTQKWIKDVIIACNFCLFAAKPIREKKVHYRVEPSETLSICLEAFLEECERLEKTPSIETTFIVYPYTFQNFEVYLEFVALVDKLLQKHAYEGVYQVASFHPDYCFEGEDPEDASNYTNRSIYPMLHILREESITQALDTFQDPESIPERNIQFAREKGVAYMKMLRDACL